MTALFEMRVRLGGDPRGFSEFVALREELTKLSHPACPDVDWARVEHLCLALFQQNGADLQSAAAFTLARSQRHGLEGMAQGVALIERLVCEWSNVWPPGPSVRSEILAWLFAQMQLSLRSLYVDVRNLPALTHLDSALLRLQLRLEQTMQIPMTSSQALRQHVEGLIQRLQRSTAPGALMPLSRSEPGPTHLMPIVIWPATPLPEIKPKSRRTAMWLCTAVATIILLCAAGWNGLGTSNRDDPVPASVRLDSLALFDAGSAELKPGSTKVLISALIDIKAQPGWLIVISGHSDDRGNPEQNRQLSHARASAVRSWMQSMGDIPDSCFAVQGVAASQPIASNDTQSGRAANRRVEISLLPQAGACGQPA